MNQFELGILDWLTTNVSHPLLDTVMPWISKLGNSGMIWIIIAVALLLFKAHRKTALTLGAALITDLLVVNVVLKPLINRIRPFILNPDYLLVATPPADGSFPSGHTAASFAAAYVLYRFNRTWGTVAYVLATAIAFSRMYLYFHYPTDILAGGIIGTLIGVFAVWFVNHFWKRDDTDVASADIQKREPVDA